MGMAVNMVEKNSLRLAHDGFDIRIRLNWYRSLPLSCIENISLLVDGQPVPAWAISFKINNREYKLAELSDLVEEFWFVLDAAKLHVSQPETLRLGFHYTIEVEIAFRLPYIPVGPEKFLVNTSKYATTLVAF